LHHGKRSSSIASRRHLVLGKLRQDVEGAHREVELSGMREFSNLRPEGLKLVASHLNARIEREPLQKICIWTLSKALVKSY
jgi:hypothetical protein